MVERDHRARLPLLVVEHRDFGVPRRVVGEDGPPRLGLLADVDSLASGGVLLKKRVLLKPGLQSRFVDKHSAVGGVVDQVLTRKRVA